MIFDQEEFDLRFEWGEAGVAALAPISDVVIIVDVLSFSTCVDIAVGRGAAVFPCAWKDERAEEYAAELGAILAGPRRSKSSFSLSPESLLKIRRGARLVLPSPNGATLSLAVGSTPVLAGCLRNTSAVARAAAGYGRKIAVVAAGERWKGDQSLRPALEDLLGAGAILDSLPGQWSPEAQSAALAFRGLKPALHEALMGCSSGKELISRGFTRDVILASELDVSDCAPVLADRAYVWAEG